MRSPGDKVGRYVVEDVLGEGGMGTVYRARDPALDRRVALKVVRMSEGETGGASLSEGTARLLREARAAAALEHPNAVAIYDTGEIDGDAFIAMELVAGRTVRNTLDTTDVPMATRLRWLTDVARVLVAAHALGIVHRDIKPDNVMVRSDGVIKVLDFGIARRLRTSPDPQGDTAQAGVPLTLTANGAPIGTPLYMAPEQMLADENVDGRADQFSWGVMAYEVLTGKLPWGTPRDGIAVMYAILRVEPPPFHADLPELPKEVEDIVMKALEKEPEDRFQSMAEIVEALDVIIAELAPASRVASSRRDPVRISAPPTRPLARRRGKRWQLVAGAVAIASTVAAVVVIARRGSEPVPSPAPSATPARVRSITDLPVPSALPEALAAYRAGVQAIHDGAPSAATENLNRAITLDAGLAAAHLRVALHGSGGGVPTRSGSFQRAQQLRGALTQRDQDLLHAFEPYMNRERVDLVETERRLVALGARHPEDAELAYLLAAVRFDTDPRSMMSALDTASNLDPTFVPPLALRAHGLAYLGDFEGAARGFQRCAEAAPSSSLCAHYQSSLDEQLGECARIEATSRRVLVAEPTSNRALIHLAAAAVSLGRPRESVLSLLEQRAAKAKESIRQTVLLKDVAQLNLFYGDFEAAEAKAKELARAVLPEAKQMAHAIPAQILVDVHTESGKLAAAGQVADEFMKRRDAWVAPTNVEDYSIRDDATVPMLTTMRQAGLLTESAYRASRERWLTEWRKNASPFYVGYLWIHGYAVPAETPAGATEALEALTTWGPIPPYRSTLLVDGSIGNVYRLAGRIEDALPYLRRATKCCRELHDPVASTRAHLWLGAALETQGDTAGACAAYKVVIARWGQAKPRSVTAEKARASMKALSCK